MLAVAMLCVATVRTVVMQAADAAAPGGMSATCMSMTAGGAVHAKGAQPDKASKVCEYCAAAAHAPMGAMEAAIPRSSAVAWMSYAALQHLGPRGPPAFAANARGPPHNPLTI